MPVITGSCTLWILDHMLDVLPTQKAVCLKEVWSRQLILCTMKKEELQLFLNGQQTSPEDLLQGLCHLLFNICCVFPESTFRWQNEIHSPHLCSHQPWAQTTDSSVDICLLPGLGWPFSLPVTLSLCREATAKTRMLFWSYGSELNYPRLIFNSFILCRSIYWVCTRWWT